jgi:hypothetical protein
MLSSKKSFVAALIAGAVAFGARNVLADTITVTNGASPSSVSTGPFAGDEAYNYVISFSSTAAVENLDGFLIADFGGYAGFAFTGSAGSVPSSSIFTESNPTGGGVVLTGLNAEVVSAVAGFDEFSTGGASPAIDFIPDAATVNDVLFLATAGTFTGTGTGSGGSLDLTLYSTETGTATTAQTMGVDHSGAGGALNLEESSVFVPTPSAAATPLPASSIGGGVLIALLAGYKVRKARQMA